MNILFISATYILAISFFIPLLREISLHFDVLNNNAVRFLSGGMFMLIGLYYYQRTAITRLLRSPRDLIIIAIIALLMTANMFFFIKGLALTSALMGSIFTLIAMPVAVLFAAGFYKDERQKAKQPKFVLGSVIALIGSLLFILFSHNANRAGDDFLLGSAFLMLAICIQAIQNLLVKQVIQRQPTLAVSTGVALGAGMIYFVLAVMNGQISTLTQESIGWLMSLVGMGIYGILAGMLFSFFIIKKLGIISFNMIGLLVPLVTAVIVSIFFNEQLSYWQIGAIIVAILGCTLTFIPSQKSPA